MDFAVITVSDRCSNGTTTDHSGEKLEAAIKADFPTSKVFRNLVPDDKTRIKKALFLAISKECSIIFTTGGTGFSPRDVTPEATREVIEREAPGLSHAMTAESLRVTPMAMLSRAVCGIFDESIIINLPGSPKAALECYACVRPALTHAVDVLRGNLKKVESEHGKKSKVVLPRAANRARESPFLMVEVYLAQLMVKEEFSKLESVYEIDISDSLGKILAEDVISGEPLPPFPASMKDGYAVKASDGVGERAVRDVVAAGDRPSEWKLEAGEIARINTGAPIPPGADAVVQVEDTEVVKASDIGDELVVNIKIAPTVGQDIRPIGCDIPADTKILLVGQIITPAVIGVLASIGKIKIKVRGRRCSVGIISTGNELQDPRETLKPGHIRDSNKFALLALLQQHDFKADDCGWAKDNPDDVFRVLTSALSKHNILVTTGGVSMGEFDVVKKVLVEDFGAKICFGRVNMKPGKPTTFAVFEYDGSKRFVFGLPGNPVSAMVTTILFVLPALRLCNGFDPAPIPMYVDLEEEIRLDPRPEFMRAWVYRNVDGKLIARKRGDQISSRLDSLVGANALLVLPKAARKDEHIMVGMQLEAIELEKID